MSRTLSAVRSKSLMKETVSHLILSQSDIRFASGNSIAGKLGRAATKPFGAEPGRAVPVCLTFGPMRTPLNAITRATQSRYAGTHRLEAMVSIQAGAWIVLPAVDRPRYCRVAQVS